MKRTKLFNSPLSPTPSISYGILSVECDNLGWACRLLVTTIAGVRTSAGDDDGNALSSKFVIHNVLNVNASNPYSDRFSYPTNVLVETSKGGTKQYPPIFTLLCNVDRPFVHIFCVLGHMKQLFETIVLIYYLN